MPAFFHKGELRFAYPENWKLDECQTAEGWSVQVQSPGTAFFLLTVYAARPSVHSVLQTALAALREDYPDLEAEESGETIAGRRAQGHDVQFFSLDWTNTCWIRALRTKTHTVLILCQTADFELDVAEPVLRAMRASLQVGN